MRRSLYIFGFLTLHATSLAGCGGEIYRTVKLNPDIDQSNSIVTDARQRLISITSPGVASRPGLVDPARIMCVEPSPDVAVAVANSLGGGLSVAGKGAFSISGAEAEGLAQIAERTTAIQAILRQGYQACIDYMNGAINGTTYSLRQSRLDDLLVTLVLAEDAAGAFGRSGAAIGTDASASSRAATSILPDISKSLGQATNDLSQRQQDVAKAENDLATAKKALADNTDQTKKDALEADVKAKQSQLDLAVAARDAALRSVTGLSEAASTAAAGVKQVTGQGGITAQPDPEIARAIAQMQETFVNKDMEQAYLSACLIELGQWKNPRDKEDSDFRALMMKRLSDKYVRYSNAIPEGKEGDDFKFEEEEIGDFYLATQVGQKTLLTQHCEKNLELFLFQAQANENTRKLIRLQLESQRIELERDKLSKKSTQVGAEVHPEAELNVALLVKKTLTEARDKLKTTDIPTTSPAPVQSELKRAKEAALERATKLLDNDAKILSEQADAAKKLEAHYLALITDPRRTASASVDDQENWQSEFNLQQKEASLLADKFADFTRRARRALSEVLSVQQKIDGTST